MRQRRRTETNAGDGIDRCRNVVAAEYQVPGQRKFGLGDNPTTQPSICNGKSLPMGPTKNVAAHATKMDDLKFVCWRRSPIGVLTHLNTHIFVVCVSATLCGGFLYFHTHWILLRCRGSRVRPSPLPPPYPPFRHDTDSAKLSTCGNGLGVRITWQVPETFLRKKEDEGKSQELMLLKLKNGFCRERANLLRHITRSSALSLVSDSNSTFDPIVATVAFLKTLNFNYFN